MGLDDEKGWAKVSNPFLIRIFMKRAVTYQAGTLENQFLHFGPRLDRDWASKTPDVKMVRPKFFANDVKICNLAP